MSAAEKTAALASQIMNESPALAAILAADFLSGLRRQGMTGRLR